MENQSYKRFLAAQELGLKSIAAAEVRAFVNSFSSIEEKANWVRENIDIIGKNNNGRIRYEIYCNVVFPVLLAGYREENAECIYWLAMYEQNTIQSAKMMSAIDHQGKISLLELAHKIKPESRKVSNALLSEYIRFFDFCDHEWPSGILYTMNGADEKEIPELTAMIAKARTLDIDGIVNERLIEFERRIAVYAEAAFSNNRAE